MAMSMAQLKQDFETAQVAKTRSRALAALAAIAKTQDGLEALWYIIDHTGLMARELWAPGVEINRRVTFRDFGAWLSHELAEANEAAFFAMQQEFWKRSIQERIAFENFVKENS